MTPVPEPKAWHRRAACRGAHDRVFPFGTPVTYDEAVATCIGCPSVEPCAVYCDSLPISERWGVWAGKLYESGRVLREVYIPQTEMLRSHLRFVPEGEEFHLSRWCRTHGVSRGNARHILRLQRWEPCGDGRWRRGREVAA